MATKIIREGATHVLHEGRYLQLGDVVELVQGELVEGEDDVRPRLRGAVVVGDDNRFYMSTGEGEPLIDFETDMELSLLAPAGSAL